MPILSTKRSVVVVIVCILNEDDAETPYSTCFQTRVWKHVFLFCFYFHVILMCEHLTFMTPILHENLMPLLSNYHHEALIINQYID